MLPDLMLFDRHAFCIVIAMACPFFLREALSRSRGLVEMVAEYTPLDRARLQEARDTYSTRQCISLGQLS